MKKIVVLGIGNRLMGDDGIGNDIVEELKRRKAFPGLRLVAGETDVEYCMDEIRDADTVILIDAAKLGKQPGAVAILSLGEILEKLPASVFPHNFDLLHGMKLRNYKRAGALIAIEACSVEWRFGLSPAMENQFSRIVDEVSQHIETCLNL